MDEGRNEAIHWNPLTLAYNLNQLAHQIQHLNGGPEY